MNSVPQSTHPELHKTLFNDLIRLVLETKTKLIVQEEDSKKPFRASDFKT